MLALSPPSLLRASAPIVSKPTVAFQGLQVEPGSEASGGHGQVLSHESEVGSSYVMITCECGNTYAVSLLKELTHAFLLTHDCIPDGNAVLRVLRAAEGRALVERAAGGHEAVAQQPDQPPEIDKQTRYIVS